MAAVLNALGISNSSKNDPVLKQNTSNVKNNMNKRPNNMTTTLVSENVETENVPKNSNSTALEQAGGVAPAFYQYPARMQQPSDRIMEWATTADAPTPSASEMRGVAHGGKRRANTHKKRKTMRKHAARKTHHHGKRRQHRKSRKHTHHKRR